MNGRPSQRKRMGIRKANKEIMIKCVYVKGGGNMLQTVSGVMSMLKSCISLESIPKWQLKQGQCGHDGWQIIAQ